LHLAILAQEQVWLHQQCAPYVLIEASGEARMDVQQHGWEIHIDVAADGFLYHMVRNIVGNLVQVGIGRWSPKELADILAAQNRTLAAATAPARGLYFTDAKYPNFSSRAWVGKEWQNK